MLSLYRDHASGLSRYAASLARNQDAARAAVQEIFLRYFVERHYGRQIENPRAWLYDVLRTQLAETPQNIAKGEISAGAPDAAGKPEHAG